MERNEKPIEIWKDVLVLYSYDSVWNIKNKYTFKKGKYKVSNLGRFKRNDKIVIVKPNSKLDYVFSLNNHRFKLHQIVLQTFEPNGIKNGYSPDHINRFDRLNNSLSNLRWADRKTQYNNRDNSEHQYKKTKCLNNGVIYNSCQEAEKKLGLCHNTVSMVARGDIPSIRGYKFKYI